MRRLENGMFGEGGCNARASRGSDIFCATSDAPHKARQVPAGLQRIYCSLLVDLFYCLIDARARLQRSLPAPLSSHKNVTLTYIQYWRSNPYSAATDPKATNSPPSRDEQMSKNALSMLQKQIASWHTQQLPGSHQAKK
jgi:hypothetical protein